jgi:hypothetical protein
VIAKPNSIHNFTVLLKYERVLSGEKRMGLEKMKKKKLSDTNMIAFFLRLIISIAKTDFNCLITLQLPRAPPLLAVSRFDDLLIGKHANLAFKCQHSAK